MAYRFKRGESVPEGVRRIVREEIGSAEQNLRGKSGANRDEAVHDARKSIKKVRALLRLVRPELGSSFTAENIRLRDAGRRLSELRDAGALIGTLDELKKRSSGALGRASLASVRRALIVHKEQVEQEVGTDESMRDLAVTLTQIRQSAKRWPLEADGFSAIESGLEKTFRDGRKALAMARKHGRREDFHEWRKRVKDHWYQVRLLEKLWSDVMQGYEQSLKELEDALGEDLNLAILRDRILSGPDGKGATRTVDLLTRAIDSSRKELRDRALAIGERVYAEKPRQFTGQIRRLWEAWLESPL